MVCRASEDRGVFLSVTVGGKDIKDFLIIIMMDGEKVEVTLLSQKLWEGVNIPTIDAPTPV